MRTQPSLRARRTALTLCLIAAALAGTPTLAATQAKPADIQARYLRDSALCMSAKYKGDRDECLSEASTARSMALPSPVDVDPGRYARNALKRCEPLPESDRRDCVARMQGQGTTTGTVAGGGIYRELVTRETEAAVPTPAEVAPPPKQASSPAPALPVAHATTAPRGRCAGRALRPEASGARLTLLVDGHGPARRLGHLDPVLLAAEVVGHVPVVGSRLVRHRSAALHVLRRDLAGVAPVHVGTHRSPADDADRRGHVLAAAAADLVAEDAADHRTDDRARHVRAAAVLAHLLALDPAALLGRA
jgi:hypothetical protein